MKTWIKVTEALPKAWEPVWVYWRDQDVTVGCRIYSPDEYEPQEGWYEYENKVRWAHYWMPLKKPEAPEIPEANV